MTTDIAQDGTEKAAMKSKPPIPWDEMAKHLTKLVPARLPGVVISAHGYDLLTHKDEIQELRDHLLKLGFRLKTVTVTGTHGLFHWEVVKQ